MQKPFTSYFLVIAHVTTLSLEEKSSTAVEGIFIEICGTMTLGQNMYDHSSHYMKFRYQLWKDKDDSRYIIRYSHLLDDNYIEFE